MILSFKNRKVSGKDAAEVVLKPDGGSILFAGKSGRKVIRIETGEFKKITRRKLASIFRQAVFLAKANKIKRIGINFSDFLFKHLGLPAEEIAGIMAVNLEMADFEFVKYKSRPRGGWSFVREAAVSGKVTPEIKRAFGAGQLLGREVNACRALANTPGGEMTPKVLADAAKTAFEKLPVNGSILGRKEIEGLKMGGVLGVAKGAKEEPKFIVIEYFAGSVKEKPVVLIG